MGEYEGTVFSGVGGVSGVARGVLSDLDLDVVRERVVEAARDVSGARCATLGVLDESRTGVKRSVTVATFSIQSTPGQGTTVRAGLPAWRRTRAQERFSAG